MMGMTQTGRETSGCPQWGGTGRHGEAWQWGRPARAGVLHGGEAGKGVRAESQEGKAMTWITSSVTVTRLMIQNPSAWEVTSSTF